MSNNENQYMVLGSNVQRIYWQSCYRNVKPLRLVSIIESRILYLRRSILVNVSK